MMTEYQRHGYKGKGRGPRHPRPHRRGQRHGNAPPPRSTIESIDIQGFKSLENISRLKFSSVNVLVGENGAGKSNFLNFFDMLGWAIRGKNLQEYVARKGGGSDLLFNSAKHTRAIRAGLTFSSLRGRNDYQFTLQHAEDNRLVFSQEEYRFSAKDKGGEGRWHPLGIGHHEAKITAKENHETAQIIRKILSGCTVYQFHDTSPEGPLKMPWDDSDTVFLRNNGCNLASVLLDLRENHAGNYREIVRLMREIVPVFHDFELEVIYGKAVLRWYHKDQKMSFGAHLTSDGTLRLMALITLLNMPQERISDVILLDEPELGLHPYAISLLGALIKRLGVDKQVIVATQSPLLLNDFSPEDIIVAEMDERGATSFKRLNEEELRPWLDKFQLGELWQKNVIGGNP